MSEPARGVARSTVRDVRCKDCLRERRNQSLDPKAASTEADEHFAYNENWAERVLERGGSRSDRCPRHRSEHQQNISALPVSYIGLETLGEAVGYDDPVGPMGPLGGLGPLPVTHRPQTSEVDLSAFKFGMTDKDICDILQSLKQNRILVLKAGTGTGKSTFAPFRLLSPPDKVDFRLTDLGQIVVTEPRVQATVGVARFVGERLVMGCPLMECSNPAHGSFNPGAHLDDQAGSSCDDDQCARPHVGEHPGPKADDCEVVDCSRHIGPGFRVGYQVAEAKNHDAACQLVYVTDGTMVNWLTQGKAAEIGTIIIDEAHERSANIEFILAYLHYALDQYPHLKVIVTSATFDVDFFVDYFRDKYDVASLNVPATKSFGYGAPLFATDGVATCLDCACEPQVFDDGRPPQDAHVRAATTYQAWRDAHWPAEVEHGDKRGIDLRAITDELQPLRFTGKTDLSKPESVAKDVGAQIVRMVRHLEEKRIYGDILAFLPTKSLMKIAIDVIEAALEPGQIDLFGLIRAAPTSHQQGAIAPRSSESKRKVVIATNLAETSLTVSGVRFVVDSGLSLTPTWDVNAAEKAFPPGNHSQAGVRQRWGRVGRDSPGWVFTLYTKEDFDRFSKNTRPEPARCNLEPLVMKAKAAGIDDLGALIFPVAYQHKSWDDDAHKGAAVFAAELGRAVSVLTENGTIKPDLEGGYLTPLGKEFGRFGSHSPNFSVTVMCADQLACATEAVTALLLLDDSDTSQKYERVQLRNLQWRPPRGSVPLEWSVQLAGRAAALDLGCLDDVEYVLRVVAAWEHADPATLPWEPSAKREAFARAWWLDHRVLMGMAELRREVLGALSPKLTEEVKRFIDVRLVDRVRAAISRGYSTLVYTRENDQLYHGPRGTEKPLKLGRKYGARPTVAKVIPLGSREEYLSNYICYQPWVEAVPDRHVALTEPFALMQAFLDRPLAATDDSRLSWNILPYLLAWPIGQAARADLREIPSSTLLAAEIREWALVAALPQAHTRDGRVSAVRSVWEVIDSVDGGEPWPLGADIPEAERDTRWALREFDEPGSDPSTGFVFSDEVDDELDSGEDVEDVIAADEAIDLNLRRTRARLTAAPGQSRIPGWVVAQSYSAGGDEVVVELVPSAAHPDANIDSGVHADLNLGSTIVVSVGPVVNLPVGTGNQRVRIFDRCDGRGRFLMPFSGQDRSEPVPATILGQNRRFLDNLRVGARLEAEVVRGTRGSKTISFVRFLWEHLFGTVLSDTPPLPEIKLAGEITVPGGRSGGTNGKKGYPGRIRLERLDEAAGVSFELEFMPDAFDLRFKKGQRVEIGVRNIKSSQWSVKLDADLAERAHRLWPDGLKIRSSLKNGRNDEMSIVKTRPSAELRVFRPIEPELRDDLLSLDSNDDWADAIWELYQRSYQIEVESIIAGTGTANADRSDFSPNTWTDDESEVSPGRCVRGIVEASDLMAATVRCGPWTAVLDVADQWPGTLEVGDVIVCRLVADNSEAIATVSQLTPWEWIIEPSWLMTELVRTDGESLSVHLRGDIKLLPDGKVRCRWQSEGLAWFGLERLASIASAAAVAIDFEPEQLERAEAAGQLSIQSLRQMPGMLWCTAAGPYDLVAMVDRRETLEPLRELFAGSAKSGWVETYNADQDGAFGSRLAELRDGGLLQHIRREVGATRWQLWARDSEALNIFLARVKQAFPAVDAWADVGVGLKMYDLRTGEIADDFSSLAREDEPEWLDRPTDLLVIDTTSPGYASDQLVDRVAEAPELDVPPPVQPAQEQSSGHPHVSDELDRPTGDSPAEVTTAPSSAGSAGQESVDRSGRPVGLRPHPAAAPYEVPPSLRPLPTPRPGPASRQPPNSIPPRRPDEGVSPARGRNAPAAIRPTSPKAVRQSASSKRTQRRVALIGLVAVILVVVATLAVTRFWPKSSPNLVATIAVGDHPDTLLMSPDGSRLYVFGRGEVGGADSSLNIIDTVTRKPMRDQFNFASPPQGQHAALSADGKSLYIADFYTNGDPDTMIFYDTTSNDPKVYLQQLPPPSGGVAVSPANGRVYMASTGGVITRWDAGFAGMSRNPLPLGVNNPTDIRVSADGTRIFAIAGGQMLSSTLSSGQTKALQVSNDQLLAFADNVPLRRLFAVSAGQLWRIDGAHMKLDGGPLGISDVRSLAVSQDGRRVFVLTASSVDVVDASSMRLITTIPTGYQNTSSLGGIAASPDSRIVYVTEPDADAVLALLVPDL